MAVNAKCRPANKLAPAQLLDLVLPRGSASCVGGLVPGARRVTGGRLTCLG